MNAPFPFGLPAPTGLYLGLYLLTLAIHLVLVSYVLIGTMWIVVSSIRSSPGDAAQTRIADAIRDWLPFALGTAITAGVAPLLFIQVLYMKPFYTANLLLFHRWMAIVPVLMIAFGLLYLLKSRRLRLGAPVSSALVSAAALACFLFVALSWTENHLLSLDSAAWPKLYESHAMRYPHPLIPLRIAMWIAAAVPLFCAVLGWQALAAQRRGQALPPGELRLLPWLALVGMAAACVCGWRYCAASGYTVHSMLWSHFTGMHFLLGVFGVILQSAAWMSMMKSKSMSRVALVATSFGAGFSLMAVLVCRERIRLGAIDLDALNHRLAKLGLASGLPVFVVCLVIAAALIAWCIRTTERNVEGRFENGDSRSIPGA